MPSEARPGNAAKQRVVWLGNGLDTSDELAMSMRLAGYLRRGFRGYCTVQQVPRNHLSCTHVAAGIDFVETRLAKQIKNEEGKLSSNVHRKPI